MINKVKVELISENEFCMFYSICRPEDALCGAEGMNISSHVMAVLFNLDKYFARFFLYNITIYSFSSEISVRIFFADNALNKSCYDKNLSTY